MEGIKDWVNEEGGEVWLGRVCVSGGAGCQLHCDSGSGLLKWNVNGQSVPGTARLVSDQLYGCSNHFRQWQEGGCYDVDKVWIWTVYVPALARKIPVLRNR